MSDPATSSADRGMGQRKMPLSAGDRWSHGASEFGPAENITLYGGCQHESKK